MTQAEKLEALVHKAIDGGFDLELNTGYATWIIVGTNIRVANRQSENYVSKSYYDMHSYQLIFDHAFARALFGEEKMVLLEVGEWITQKENDNLRHQWTIDNCPAFQHHLQQAVISKDPIDYMYKAVFGE